MSQAPPIHTQPGGPPMSPQRPHRGVLVLVLGILGLVVCFICGIVAWVLANSDLREMEAGLMDPSGRGMTLAGKILGIISVAFVVLGILFYVLIFVVLGVAAAAGAGSGP